LEKRIGSHLEDEDTATSSNMVRNSRRENAHSMIWSYRKDVHILMR